jgi:tetratricopeptide repeat protein 21B
LIKNSKDAVLARKIGQALIKSHQYNKAISYYMAALKSGHQNLLRYDLAELYTKLNQLDNAEKIISEALSDISKRHLNFFNIYYSFFRLKITFLLTDSDTEYLGMVARCYLLAYDVNQKRGRSELLLTSLDKSKEYQLKAIKRGQVDNPDLLAEYNKSLSKSVLFKILMRYTSKVLFILLN